MITLHFPASLFCIRILPRTAFSSVAHCFQCLQDITGRQLLCWEAGRTVSMPDTWKGLFCLSNNLICSFSSLMDLVYKPYKWFIFLLPLSVSSSMLSIFSSDFLRLTHVCILWIQSGVPEKIPGNQGTVIQPVHKLLACSLVWTQPIPAWQFKISPKNTLWYCWRLQTPKRAHFFTVFHLPASVLFWRLIGVSSSGHTLCVRCTASLLIWTYVNT